MEPSSELQPVPSKAAIAGHPIHPMVIPFPIAMLVLVPITDILFATTGRAFWSVASYYLLWGGVLTGALAAVIGLVDFISVRRVRQVAAGWIHLGANVVVMSIAVINLVLRADNVIRHVAPTGLALSIVTAALLVVSGWYGGELAYRHRIGVTQPRPRRRPARAAGVAAG